MLETPQANEHHRFDGGFTHGEDPHFRVLLHGSADDVTNAELAEHAGHKAEVVQHVAAGKEADITISADGEESLWHFLGKPKK